MNFAQVKQANGQNVTLFATFDEVGGVSLTPKNRKQVCKCQIIDDDKERHLVRLYGTMPTPAMLKMRQEFSLSSYQGQNQQGQPYTGYSGFWNDRVQVNQVPANAPPAPYATPQPPQGRPQAPQQSAQPPNVPQAPQAPPSRPQALNMPDTYAYPVTPETARRMARTAFMTAMLGNGQKPLYSYVTELVEYSYTGIEPRPAQAQTNPDYVGDGQEGICPHCQKPHEDCTCTIPF